MLLSINVCYGRNQLSQHFISFTYQFAELRASIKRSLHEFYRILLACLCSDFTIKAPTYFESLQFEFKYYLNKTVYSKEYSVFNRSFFTMKVLILVLLASIALVCADETSGADDAQYQAAAVGKFDFRSLFSFRWFTEFRFFFFFG